MIYTYNNQNNINVNQITSEIRSSLITVALDSVTLLGDQLTVSFKASLSSPEELILAELVDSHSPSPDEQEPQLVSLNTPKDANGRPIYASSPFSDAGGFRFRGASFKGTIDANTTKGIDFKIEHERWINGGRAIINNIGEDDRVTFQVVDKDNIFGFGAGVVLDEFISDFYVPQDGNLEISLAYPAKIIAGLYIRLNYTSTHESGCILKCNLYLHWKAA